MCTQSRRQRLRIASQAGSRCENRTGLGGGSIDCIEHREGAIAQFECLRLRVLCECIPQTQSERNHRKQKNRRRDPPGDGSDTRYMRDTSMCNEVDHPSRPAGLLRLPVAFCRLFNPARELQKHLSLVVDKERESSSGTDNQTEDKCAHKIPPLRSPDYIQISSIEPTRKPCSEICPFPCASFYARHPAAAPESKVARLAQLCVFHFLTGCRGHPCCPPRRRLFSQGLGSDIRSTQRRHFLVS